MTKTIYILEGNGFTGKSRFAHTLINKEKAYVCDEFMLTPCCIDNLKFDKRRGVLDKYENFLFIMIDASKAIQFFESFFGDDASIVIMRFNAVKKVNWKIGEVK